MLSMLALLLMLPIMLLIAIALRVSGEGEIIYRQLRIGKGGREFQLLKFATMIKNSPMLGAGEITLPNDTRVTPLGRILRKTKLNELPQLFNILAGDLSIIGPRPQTRRYYELYNPIDRALIETIRPGLSGVGSILFRDEEKLLSKVADPINFDDQVIAPFKGRIEHWFAVNQSIILYFELIFISALVVLLPSFGLHKNLLRRVPPAPQKLLDLLNL